MDDRGVPARWARFTGPAPRVQSSILKAIRKEGSELWANWNPRRKQDVIDEFLRQKKPDNAIVVRANWRDNPWFPGVLEEKRQLDLQLYPERYPHIWEGEYARAFEGAYFARHLEKARQQGRIAHVAVDPVLPVKAFFDIGGAGHSSDAMAIWIAQFVGREIRLLDYVEGVGQPLAHYAHELRRNLMHHCNAAPRCKCGMHRGLVPPTY
jgi:phage terminase large subunit